MKLGAVKNNPGFQTDDALVSGFVVRRQAFRRAMNTMRHALAGTGGSRSHHLLLLGRRGMGKTTLSLRLAAELRRCPELSKIAIPIVFPEESYEVASVGELALAALRHYAHQNRDAAVLARVEDLEASQHVAGELAAAALSDLEALAAQRRVSLVLVVENLDMLLDEQLGNDAAAQIARMLDRCPWLYIIASAVAGIPATEQPNSPLFERFQMIRLPPLSVADCRTLWHANDGSSGDGRPSGVVGGSVPQAEVLLGDRIRPIHILTGGSPRLLKIIAAAAPGRTLADLMDELLLFVDEHTSYFKSMLESLPPVERRVFAAMADIWAPATAREIALRARLDVNRTSSLSHRLAGRGAAEVTRVVGRTKSYQVADRSYNLYHLLRRGGPQSERLHALVAFMVQFYRGETFRPLAPVDAERSPLSSLQGRAALGEWDAVLTSIQDELAPYERDASRLRQDAPVAEVAELLTTAIARGHAETVELVLAGLPAWGLALEPLIVAMHWAQTHEEPEAPQEVRAVALDVLSTISARRQPEPTDS